MKVQQMIALCRMRIAAVLLFVFAAVFFGCEKDSDGPISISNEIVEYEGQGFFLAAMLDSGRTIHLAQDTLFLTMSKIWSFSNCALKAIDIKYQKQDSVLTIAPVIDIKTTGEDCAAPYYRPDTVIRILMDEKLSDGIGMIKVKNDADSILDSIIVRRGIFKKDTFSIYMDSSFRVASNFPLRTKEKIRSKETPTILRVLDSLTSRKFYWKTMEANCTHRVDMCKSIVADTLYPTSWNINDTNLVPIHYACADSDSVYCINSKWENDSTALGKLQERPDTIWHYSTYFVEKIPDCSTYESFRIASGYSVGQKVLFIRQLMEPSEKESYCGPASDKNWMIYDLGRDRMVLDSDSIAVVADLLKIWKDADVAPESLMVKDTL